MKKRTNYVLFKNKLILIYDIIITLDSYMIYFQTKYQNLYTYVIHHFLAIEVFNNKIDREI